MTRRPTPSKRLSSDNLARLGADRLAELLIQVSGDDAIWKRRLRMELAAEVSEGDLAAEIDKRLITLAGGKARISWRKRPELIRDLQSVRRAIVDRLAAMDPRLALDRMVAWFALYPGLAGRVRDPKDELLDLYQDAAPELGALASTAHKTGVAAAARLAEFISARPGDWSRWLFAAGDTIDPALAKAVLVAVRPEGAPPAALRPVITRLADLSGDVDTWLEAFAPAQRKLPEVGAQIALRLLSANRVAEARAALNAAQPSAATAARWSLSRTPATAQAVPAWDMARIAVLDAEGHTEDAQHARWALFERDLSGPALRDYISRLKDFDDVVALEKAFAYAGAFPRFTTALEFLMDWPELREAAALVLARPSEVAFSHPRTAEWAARLDARSPDAADILLRRQR